MTDNPIQVWFRAISAGLGFAQRGSSAHRQTDDVIQVVNLQKSTYGSFYYINLGIALKSLGAANRPREEQCHIRIRMTGLLGDAARDLDSLLDLESPVEAGERILRLEGMAGDAIRQFTESASTMSGLRSLYRSGVLSNAWIEKRARAELEN